MTHPVLRNFIQLVLIGAGVLCLGLSVLLAPFWNQWRFANGVVELRPSPDRPADMVRQVKYTRADGVETSVPFPEETLPAGARPGDHVRVAYIPESKNAIVYTFRAVWGTAALAGVLGVVFTSLGLYFHQQRKLLVTGSHAQTAEPAD